MKSASRKAAVKLTCWVVSAAAVVCFALAVAEEGSASQDTGTTPAVSQDEQAIYQAVLESWLGPKHGTQLVDRRLGPPPSASNPEYAECTKGGHFAEPPAAASDSKILIQSAFGPSQIKLIDGETWSATDPEQSIRQGGSVDAAVNEAMSRSLITFSQIAFSEDRKDALVSFGMACGRLCGTGFTLRMHRSNTQWKIAKRCGEYMS